MFVEHRSKLSIALEFVPYLDFFESEKFRRNLFATFGGPWSDYPCRIQDMEAMVGFLPSFALIFLNFCCARICLNRCTVTYVVGENCTAYQFCSFMTELPFHELLSCKSDSRWKSVHEFSISLRHVYPMHIQVPDEYLTNAIIRDKLPTIKLTKLSEDVLFYLFYNCPGEVYQVAAASELLVFTVLLKVLRQFQIFWHDWSDQSVLRWAL